MSDISAYRVMGFLAVITGGAALALASASTAGVPLGNLELSGLFGDALWRWPIALAALTAGIYLLAFDAD
jgi:hypothetical protein